MNLKWLRRTWANLANISSNNRPQTKEWGYFNDRDLVCIGAEPWVAQKHQLRRNLSPSKWGWTSNGVSLVRAGSRFSTSFIFVEKPLNREISSHVRIFSKDGTTSAASLKRIEASDLDKTDVNSMKEAQSEFVHRYETISTATATTKTRMMRPDNDDDDVHELRAVDVATSVTRRLSKEVVRRLSLDARRRSYQVCRTLIFLIS